MVSEELPHFPMVCPFFRGYSKCMCLACDTRILRRFNSFVLTGAGEGVFLFKLLISFTEFFLYSSFATFDGGMILIMGFGGRSAENSVAPSSSLNGLSEMSVDISSKVEAALVSVGGISGLILLLYADFSCFVSSEFRNPLMSSVKFSFSIRCSRRSSKLFCR